jgi:predicted permease
VPTRDVFNDNLTMRFINELMTSWAVQLIIAALVGGLVIVAFTRASRIFDDDRARRAFRIAVTALGVLVVLQAVITAILGRTPIVPVVVIEWVWLAAMFFYCIVRFLSRQRSGSGDPETRRRGAALDGSIRRLEDERRDKGAAGEADESAAPR